MFTRKKFIFAFSTVLSVALSVTHAFGAVYYVATDGKDGNTGSKDKPFATLNKANAVVAAGIRCGFAAECTHADMIEGKRRALAPLLRAECRET